MEFRDGEWINLFPFGNRPDIPESEWGRRLFLVRLDKVDLPEKIPINKKVEGYKLCMMKHSDGELHWAFPTAGTIEQIADTILLVQDYEAEDILGKWLWMFLGHEAPETIPWSVFYKKCRWLCEGGSSQDPDCLVFCNHKDNPDKDCEGNCNANDCPIYGKFSKG